MIEKLLMATHFFSAIIFRPLTQININPAEARFFNQDKKNHCWIESGLKVVVSLVFNECPMRPTFLSPQRASVSQRGNRFPGGTCACVCVRWVIKGDLLACCYLFWTWLMRSDRASFSGRETLRCGPSASRSWDFAAAGIHLCCFSPARVNKQPIHAHSTSLIKAGEKMSRRLISPCVDEKTGLCASLVPRGDVQWK